MYRIRPGVHAIYEPYHFQEAIAYLIEGPDRALLVDTLMGIGGIGDVVRNLTELPVIVVNTHSHRDHTGGNGEFDEIWAMDTGFTRRNAAAVANDAARRRICPGVLARELPPGVDPERFAIPAFEISRHITDGEVIDLGGRRIEVIATPGHTPDSICLLDREEGLLLTGDTFYEGPVYLFSPETDMEAYDRSVEKLASLAPASRTQHTCLGPRVPVQAAGCVACGACGHCGARAGRGSLGVPVRGLLPADGGAVASVPAGDNPIPARRCRGAKTGMSRCLRIASCNAYPHAGRPHECSPPPHRNRDRLSIWFHCQ